VIRAATRDDIARLQAIEVAAGAAFVDVGMPDIAGDDPLATEVLAAYVDAARAWVATDADDDAVAYVVVDLVDGHAHVEQVSVHPDAARQGLGRRLLDHVAAWAAERGMSAVTLTTFRDVPWNAPYYARCGYRILRDDERGPELVALMQHEADAGLDPAQRVAMLREVQHLP
jgi:GNAT superfamily N-acetyltransferase